MCYQAFNLATLRLEQISKTRKGLPLAIITDIDETILDNSYFEAELIRNDSEYSFELWKQWTDKASATLVPGAGNFLKEAKKKGISIFYISNRDTSEIKSTLINLKKYNLPDADMRHLIFQKDESSKEARRNQVMKNYNVVLLLGDNLNDFTALFEKKSSHDRKTEVDNVEKEWGKRFIVIPNGVYGEWENALYNYKHHLTPEQRNKILMEALTDY